TIINTPIRLISTRNTLLQLGRNLPNNLPPKLPLLLGNILKPDLLDKLNLTHTLLISRPSLDNNLMINFPIMFIASTHLPFIMFPDNDNPLLILTNDFLTCNPDDFENIFNDVFFEPAADGGE